MTKAELLRAAPFIAMLLLATALAFGLFSGNAPGGLNERLIGYHVAPFDVPLLGNKEAHFSPAAWQGRVAVLNVFASWCEPCAVEHEVLMKIAKSGKVAVYGLAWRDKPEKATEWIRQRGNPYQAIGVDEHGKSTVALALTGVPETFVLDRDGLIAYHYNGALTDDLADNLILPLVEKLNAK